MSALTPILLDMPPATATKPGKRERLIASARELLHTQGVERTTLAQIAEAADVPAGNVYYYFKTRDELVEAVVASRLADVDQLLTSLDARPSPKARLRALAKQWESQSQMVAAHGCPLGSLSCELNKRPGADADRMAAPIFDRLLTWSTRQFREMGRRDARSLAESLIAGIQGAALLANTMRDPLILVREARRLERWVDTLA